MKYHGAKTQRLIYAGLVVNLLEVVDHGRVPLTLIAVQCIVEFRPLQNDDQPPTNP